MTVTTGGDSRVTPDANRTPSITRHRPRRPHQPAHSPHTEKIRQQAHKATLKQQTTNNKQKAPRQVLVLRGMGIARRASRHHYPTPPLIRLKTRSKATQRKGDHHGTGAPEGSPPPPPEVRAT